MSAQGVRKPFKVGQDAYIYEDDDKYNAFCDDVDPQAGQCRVCLGKKKQKRKEVLTECDACLRNWHISCLPTGCAHPDDGPFWQCPDCKAGRPKPVGSMAQAFASASGILGLVRIVGITRVARGEAEVQVRRFLRPCDTAVGALLCCSLHSSMKFRLLVTRVQLLQSYLLHTSTPAVSTRHTSWLTFHTSRGQQVAPL